MPAVLPVPTLTPGEVARLCRWRKANPAAWAEALREAKRDQFEEAQFAAIAVLRRRMQNAPPAAETRAAISILKHLNALVRHGFAAAFLDIETPESDARAGGELPERPEGPPSLALGAQTERAEFGSINLPYSPAGCR